MEKNTIQPNKTYTLNELAAVYGVSGRTLKAKIVEKLPFYAAVWYKNRKRVYWPDEVKVIEGKLNETNDKHLFNQL